MEHDTTRRGPGPGPGCHHPDISHLGSAAWLLVPGISAQERREEEEKRGCFVTRNPVPHPALGSRHVPPLAHIPGPRGSGRSSVLLLTLLLGGLLYCMQTHAMMQE